MASPFTQQDPIGLAGGLNLYGYANGDPINGSDPFGLKVCFEGANAADLAAAARIATGTNFTLDVEGCATNVTAVGKKFSKQGSGFAEMAESDFFVRVQYGAVSENGASGITIFGGDVGKGYGLVPTGPGTCSGGPNAIWDLSSIVGHELGHAYATFMAYSKSKNRKTAIIWENSVHHANGRPNRSQNCHVK